MQNSQPIQRQERDRIRKEELELLRQHQATLSAHQAKIQRLQDEETFERHKQMLDDAEQERRAQIMAEEQKLHDQRMRYAKNVPFPLPCTLISNHSESHNLCWRSMQYGT